VCDPCGSLERLSACQNNFTAEVERPRINSTVPMKCCLLLRALLYCVHYTCLKIPCTDMWRFGIWFSRRGGVEFMVGLDDLRGLFQPMIL